MKQNIILSGADLSLTQIRNFLNDSKATVSISLASKKSAEKTKKFLNENIESRVIYGVNTGFGPMASHIIGRRQLLELQVNLIRSHAVGMGKPIVEEYVLAAMLVRLNTLANGNSGVSVKLLEQLERFINERIIPVVPEHGAVGTSGDLVQLAHIALSLIGEGEVFYKGKRQKTEQVLKKLKIKPLTLEPKEGLALINGTSMMSGIMAVNCILAERAISLVVHSSSLALELVRGFDDSISEGLSLLRPHKGQIAVAKAMRKILSGSKLLQKRDVFSLKQKMTDDVHEIDDDVQNVYSLRCVPQIAGPVYDALNLAKSIVEVEINSVTDNPIIDVSSKKFFHGGNFHGDYISYASDQLKMTLVKLTMLAERRVNYFLNHKINLTFPPFLNLKQPGLNLALQGLQFVATSTTARNQTLAYPQYVHSISTNSDNQDVVSMGTDSALLTAEVLANLFIVIGIELVALSQASKILNKESAHAPKVLTLLKSVREFVPLIFDDRVFYPELDFLVEALKNDVAFSTNVVE